MKLLYSILLLLLFANSSFSQEAKGEKIVSFLVIDKPPIYKGCKGNKSDLNKCFSKGIQNFFSNNFNKDLPNQLGLKKEIYKLYIGFIINKEGNAVKVRASRAPHPKIEQEVIRVVKLFPKMIPGEKQGEKVGVKYSIPFLFRAKKKPKKNR